MGIGAIIRNVALPIAKRVTEDMQPLVEHEVWLSQTSFGKPVFAPVVLRPALIDWEQKLVESMTGQEAMSRAKITFLDPVVINEKDRLTLPDTTTGPILTITGPVDKETGRAFFTEVRLG